MTLIKNTFLLITLLAVVNCNPIRWSGDTDTKYSLILIASESRKDYFFQSFFSMIFRGPWYEVQWNFQEGDDINNMADGDWIRLTVNCEADVPADKVR